MERKRIKGSGLSGLIGRLRKEGDAATKHNNNEDDGNGVRSAMNPKLKMITSTTQAKIQPIMVLEQDDDGGRNNNFFNKTRFSENGEWIMAIDEESSLRLFPQHRTSSSTITINESERIYDALWHSSGNVITSCRDVPIHMWNADSTKIEASFAYFDDKEVIRSSQAMCLSRQSSGNRLIAGYDRRVCIFDINCPGAPIENRPTKETRNSKQGQNGYISCMDSCPDLSGLYAAGSYSGSVCLYGENLPSTVSVCEIQPKKYEPSRTMNFAFTQVRFGGENGKYLYTACRKDPVIRCWDLRKLEGTPLFCIPRGEGIADTNQRIGFDIAEVNNKWIMAFGTCEKDIQIWDCSPRNPAPKPMARIRHDEYLSDVVNSVSFQHGASQTSSAITIAATTGKRHFKVDDSESDSENESSLNRKRGRAVEDHRSGLYTIQVDLDAC